MIPPKRIRCYFICQCLPLLILSGCDSQPELPLRVGTNQWLGYGTLYLARSLAFYDESTIRLVELPSSTEVMHALRTGNLEATAVTLNECLSQLQAGIDLRVVLVMDISAGANVLMAHPDITNLDALRGCRVANALELAILMMRKGLLLRKVEVDSLIDGSWVLEL